ncbi:MAG: 50S ribosomal protein L29 [Elusimicrobiota bacterium]|nr:50S ribosomal protein L29 [Elusimicrobiota bacterium]
MKSKQWQELKNLTEQELQLQLEEKQKKLFKLKLQHKSAPLKNPLQLRELRRDIAKINTLLSFSTVKRK